MNRYARHRGFSLIELLVVFATITVLIALLVPALSKARAQAVRQVCASNLRGVGVGMAIYLYDHREWMLTFSRVQTVFPLASIQSADHVNYVYSRSLWPDRIRGCPDVLAAASVPAPYNFGLTTSGLTGASNLYWGYETPALNEDAVLVSGGRRIVDHHPDATAAPLSTDQDFEYLRLVGGEMAKDRYGTLKYYGGKNWEPHETKPLAADMISYALSPGRIVAGHLPGNAMAKVNIGPGLAIKEIPQIMGITGGNQLWHDLHVWWQPFDGQPQDDYRRIATGQQPAGMTAEYPSRFYYYFAKPSRRIQ
jgi:type II secretory pathway pseudopilin PulG